MHLRSRLFMAFGLLIIASMVLAACQPPSEQQIQTVRETVQVVVTEIVEQERTVEVEVMVTPTAAPAPQGGTMVESTFADATILNPILSNDSASSDVHEKIYLPLVDEDAFSGELIGIVADSWEVSDDGLVYTFHLNEDVVWSDGTPLTARDFKFSYDAIASDLVETPRKSNVELVESIEVIDDYTVEVTFSQVDCAALQNFTLGILPAHMYAEDFSDVMESPENNAPSVASGPFVFQEWVPDDHVTLVRNENYYAGAPNVEAWFYRVFADQSAELAAVLAGEVDISTVSAPFVSTIEGAVASGQPLQIEKFFDDGYTWIAFNLADPANPQHGFVDENENDAYDEGEPVQEQDPHPILGDVAVRQAISHAVDYTNIVNRVVFGEGVQALANVLPAIEWAYADQLEPYEYDLEQAQAILDEAGWVDSNGDGIREKDGQTLSLSLQTNAGNEVRENIILLVEENLDSIGFDIETQAVEFSTLIGEMLSQTYDMVLLGWTNKGSDPDDVGLWEYRFDTVGSGFNFTSYYSPEIEELGQQAKSLPGCDLEERGELYGEIQQMLHEDAPYVFLYVPLTNVVWNTRLQGIEPGPWQTYYNVDDWYIAP